MLTVLLMVGTAATAGVENHVEAEISGERTSEVEVQIEPSLLKHTVVSEVGANFAASFDPATMTLATGQRYTGAIDGKYPITLQFYGQELTKLYTDEGFAKTCKDTTVSGSYSYVSQSDSLGLAIDVCALANHKFKAVRYEGYGDARKVRETFKGTIQYNGRIYGTWQKNGKEAKPFVLNVVSDEFTESEKLLFLQKVLSIEGQICKIKAEDYGLYKGVPYLQNYNGSYCDDFWMYSFSAGSLSTTGVYTNSNGDNDQEHRFILGKQGSNLMLTHIISHKDITSISRGYSVSIYQRKDESWQDITQNAFPKSIKFSKSVEYKDFDELFDSEPFSVHTLPNGLQVEGNTLVWNNGKLVLQSK